MVSRRIKRIGCLTIIILLTLLFIPKPTWLVIQKSLHLPFIVRRAMIKNQYLGKRSPMGDGLSIVWMTLDSRDMDAMVSKLNPRYWVSTAIPIDIQEEIFDNCTTIDVGVRFITLYYKMRQDNIYWFYSNDYSIRNERVNKIEPSGDYTFGLLCQNTGDLFFVEYDR